MLSCHACIPAPTAYGQRTPTSCPKAGQPGGHERLTPDAPQEGKRHRLRGCPPAAPTAHERSALGLVRGPHTRTSNAQRTRAMGPGCLHQGWAGGRGTAPNPKCPPRRHEAPVPANSSHPPPQRATPARKNMRWRVGVWPPYLVLPRPRQMVSGPQLPVPGTGSQRRESA